MTAATNWREVDEHISKVVRGSLRPVAVAFLDEEPAGVKKYQGRQPSGCSFWRLAAEGRTFYTVPEDHFNCAVVIRTTSRFPRIAKRRASRR